MSGMDMLMRNMLGIDPAKVSAMMTDGAKLLEDAYIANTAAHESLAKDVVRLSQDVNRLFDFVIGMQPTMLERIGHEFGRHQEELNYLRHVISQLSLQLENSFDDVETYIDGHFGAIDKRLESIEAQLSGGIMPAGDLTIQPDPALQLELPFDSNGHASNLRM